MMRLLMQHISELRTILNQQMLMNIQLTLLLIVSSMCWILLPMVIETNSVVSPEQPVLEEKLYSPAGQNGHLEDTTEKEKINLKPAKNSSMDGVVNRWQPSFGLPIPNNPAGGSLYLPN